MAKEIMEKTKARLRRLVDNSLPKKNFSVTLNRKKKVGSASWYDFDGVTMNYDSGPSQDYIENYIVQIIARKAGVEIYDPLFNHSGNGHFHLEFKIR